MNLTARIGTPLLSMVVALPERENDFDNQLLGDSEQFMGVGVDMIYKSSAGGSRNITGVIDYEGEDLISAIDGVTLKFIVSVPNNSTTGISSDEITEGGRDKITIQPRIGLTVADRPIRNMLGQDAGMLQLEVG